LRDDPPPLEAPPALTQIVKRCLEKSPAHRYQTAAEVRTALEQLSTTEEQGASIAVLPFANLSSDPEQEYFSDGLTEEIINALAHVPGLKVIARTSAFAFKGQQLPIGRIAKALGVKTILEGSVRRASTRIRVTAQLVDVSNGFHLWSERYDRELADVFAVQDDIASAIASELRGRFRVDEPSASYTPRVAAYEAYMMARHHVWQGLSRERFAQGLRCYEQAIALDPRFALPHAALAEMFHIVASGKGPEAQAAAARIRPSLERAIALDPELPEAHAWLGIVATTYDYDWAEGERQFRAAMAKEPVTPGIRHMNAYFNLRLRGRAEEAIAEHHRAIEQDPLNMIFRVGLAASLTSAGRDAEASQVVDTLMELAPDFPATYGLLARNVALAPLEQALAFAEQFYARTIFNAASTGLLAGLLRRHGDDSRASDLMAQAGPPEEYGNAVGYALYHLANGETDRAFDFMQLAVDQRHPLLMMIIVGGPYAPALRASSRWPSFARTIGLD
jgi:serine/threonine-protein kinase